MTKNNPKTIQYQGTIQPQTGEWNEIIKREIYPYYPDDDLKEAVNLAIRLNKPLLLEGKPGCGKSHLAHALVYEFSQKYPELNWQYQLWNIQSISKAEDGFYTYDYIGRLQAAQLGKEIAQKNPANPEIFVNKGALGKAFEDSNNQIRTIVLIDEIDKADSDLPNDLLLALEAQRFEIKEIPNTPEYEGKRWIIANREYLPIIIITSNREKDLPHAFLRRCLYHYIELPSQEQLTDIIRGRFNNPPVDLIEMVLHKFLELRDRMEEERGDVGKIVSTSELIDWFEIIYQDYQESPETIKQKLEEILPYKGTLLKSYRDLKDYGY